MKQPGQETLHSFGQLSTVSPNQRTYCTAHNVQRWAERDPPQSNSFNTYNGQLKHLLSKMGRERHNVLAYTPSWVCAHTQHEEVKCLHWIDSSCFSDGSGEEGVGKVLVSFLPPPSPPFLFYFPIWCSGNRPGLQLQGLEAGMIVNKKL